MDNRLPSDNRPSFELTPRDIRIVQAVNDYRALTAAQVQHLFGMKRSPVQRRLHGLFHHEYLDRQSITVYERKSVNAPLLYTLGSRGAHLLITTHRVSSNDITRPRKRWKWKFVDHLLAINDFRVAVSVAARQHEWELVNWLDERVFRANPDYVSLRDSRGKAQKKPVYPDGYFCLAVPQGKAHFLLEVDRGVEERKDFRPQILIHEEYVASHQYQKRFQTTSLRILIVTTDMARLETLQAWVESAGGDDKYWFTTSAAFEDPQTSVLTAPIWQELGTDSPQPLIDLA